MKSEMFLPAYSPQINLDEYLSNGLNQNPARRRSAKNKLRLDVMASVFMLMLSAAKEHVQAFLYHS